MTRTDQNKRRQEISRLKDSGLSVKEISAKLDITESTVYYNLKNRAKGNPSNKHKCLLAGVSYYSVSYLISRYKLTVDEAIERSKQFDAKRYEYNGVKGLRNIARTFGIDYKLIHKYVFLCGITDIKQIVESKDILQ